MGFEANSVSQPSLLFLLEHNSNDLAILPREIYNSVQVLSS